MRDLLTRDLGWKLFSLLLATVVWFTVRTLSRDALSPARLPDSWVTRSFDELPILVVSAASDVHEFRVDPPVARVTVSGRAELLRALESRDIRVMVDLTGVEPAGDLRKRLDVSVPAGVTLVSVVPTEVRVLIPPAMRVSP